MLSSWDFEGGCGCGRKLIRSQIANAECFHYEFIISYIIHSLIYEFTMKFNYLDNIQLNINTNLA